MMNKINAFFNRLFKGTNVDRGYEQHAKFDTISEYQKYKQFKLVPLRDITPLKETTVVFEGGPSRW